MRWVFIVEINKKQVPHYLYLILFIGYISFLTKLIIFRYPYYLHIDDYIYDIENLYNHIKMGNFIPFKSIFYYISGKETYWNSIYNLIGNIIVFIPLGYLFPMVNKKISSHRSIIIYGFFTSFIFEVIQLYTWVGNFDVDDIILNIFGTWIGFLIYMRIKRIVIKR